MMLVSAIVILIMWMSLLMSNKNYIVQVCPIHEKSHAVFLVFIICMCMVLPFKIVQFFFF